MELIKNIEEQNRPREKMIREGAQSLTDVELLAIIIGSGTKNNSVLSISKSLLDEFGSLSNLLNSDVFSLMNVKGIKQAKSVLIAAIIEIVKRANREKLDYNKPIGKSEDVYLLIKDELENLEQEMFLIIFLNVKLKIIKKEVLFKGGSTTAYIDTNMIFKKAIRYGAKNIICVHNHPSGDVTPSEEDIRLTNNIRNIAMLTNINFLDHIIVGKNNYFSFKKSNI